MVRIEDELRGNIYEQFADRKHASFLVNIFKDPDNPWCYDVLTVPNENCLDAATIALDRATEFLEDSFKGNIPLFLNICLNSFRIMKKIILILIVFYIF